MCSLDFSALKCTTATLIVENSGQINLDAAFSLISITHIDLPIPKRHSQKYKIPFVEGQAGAILSLRYKGSTRGIIRSNSSKHFKNSITCDVVCQSKNVSLKLSNAKFQLCGASSVAQGNEAATYIIRHLLDVQDHFDVIQGDAGRAQATAEWLINATQGESTFRFSGEKVAVGSNTTEESSSSVESVDGEKKDDGSFEAGGSVGAMGLPLGAKKRPNLVLVEPDFTICLPGGWAYMGVVDGIPRFVPIEAGEEGFVPMPDHVDARLVAFFLRFMRDFAYHSDYASELNWILQVPRVVTRDIRIEKVSSAMVNYNISCQHSINRFELARRITGLNLGFTSRYDNAIEHCVTLHKQYNPSFYNKIQRKKAKACVSTILCYSSGICTLSSINETEAKIAYDAFNQALVILRPYIFKENPTPRKLTFKASKKNASEEQVEQPVVEMPPVPTSEPEPLASN